MNSLGSHVAAVSGRAISELRTALLKADPTSHVREFLAAVLQIVSVLCLHGVLDRAGNRIIRRQDRALHKLHFTRSIPLEPAAAASSSSGHLSLPPGLGGAGLAPAVRRRDSVRDAEASSWVLVTLGVDATRIMIACIVGGCVGVIGVTLRQGVARRRTRIRRAVARVGVVKRPCVIGTAGIQEGALCLLVVGTVIAMILLPRMLARTRSNLARVSSRH